MLRNPWWIFGSISILIIIWWLYFLHYKNRFVVPMRWWARVYSIMTVFVTMILLVIPLNIQIPQGSNTEIKNYVPIQILFDISLSMVANDIEPSRFVAAKEMIDELLVEWEDYPVSLILFSGIPFVHVPFSDDTASIRAKRKTTYLGQFPPVAQFVGTAIGDALLLGVQNIEKNNFSDAVVLLVTDGDSNKWYEPDDVIGILEKRNIPLFAVGIWQPDNFIVWYDHFGAEVTTTYNPDFLRTLTDQTGGETRVVEDNMSMQNISRIIDQAIQSYTKDYIIEDYRSINYLLLYLLLLRLLVITSWRWRIRYSKK